MFFLKTLEGPTKKNKNLPKNISWFWIGKVCNRVVEVKESQTNVRKHNKKYCASKKLKRAGGKSNHQSVITPPLWLKMGAFDHEHSKYISSNSKYDLCTEKYFLWLFVKIVMFLYMGAYILWVRWHTYTSLKTHKQNRIVFFNVSIIHPQSRMISVLYWRITTQLQTNSPTNLQSVQSVDWRKFYSKQEKRKITAQHEKCVLTFVVRLE